MALCLRQYLMVGLGLRFQDVNVVACVAESLAFGSSVGEKRSLIERANAKNTVVPLPKVHCREQLTSFCPNPRTVLVSAEMIR
ncbi:hypothetical protein H6F98_02835 [Microcoleus sp. FACHB-SPT15]|uniref:hypothetical protein n=1 Tax=Microcoleus sp. FACHB-SPT15 TaxID=2692830 RepID=UPI00177ED3C3|nr:hypothetical protein [Microcoleus sp. FACHB-SPT15]MBD1804408.1 hypothetical protein [Microcoleus sp. FACHB-SPT15]